MLAKPNRLTRKTDFDRVFKADRGVHHQLLSLRAAPAEAGPARIGIICGKQVGGAVTRNRARRRLRVAARSLLPALPAAWDILLVIRPPGANATVAEFVYALEEVLRRRKLAAEARLK